MKFIVRNDVTRLVTGGKDNLKGDMWKIVNDYLSVPVDGKEHILKRREKEFRDSIASLPKDERQYRLEKWREGAWDGNYRLMTNRGDFPTGFLPMVVKLVKGYGVDIVFEDQRSNLPIFKRELDFSTPFFDLYEHQRVLIEKTKNSVISTDKQSLYFPRGVWSAATNSGKTAAFGSLVSNVVNGNALLLVNEQGLFEQHIAYYRKWFGDTVGVIGSVPVEGRKSLVLKFEPGHPVTVAMVETLHNRLKKDENIRYHLSKDYNILGVDECHDFSSPTAYTVIQAVNAGIKVLMSGTPLDNASELANMKLVGLGGKVLHRVSKKYLMDNGFSMVPIVKVFRNPDVLHTRLPYAQEYERLVMLSEKRANLIADIIYKRIGRKILVTFFEKAHGYFLYETLINKYPDCFDMVDIVHGSDEFRHEKVNRFIDNPSRILISSEILKQGYNIPDIQTIIYAQGEKDPKSMSQFLGRGERLDGINTRFEWIDFYDSGVHTSKHSRKRIEFYNKEQLQIKFMYKYNKYGTPTP